MPPPPHARSRIRTLLVAAGLIAAAGMVRASQDGMNAAPPLASSVVVDRNLGARLRIAPAGLPTRPIPSGSDPVDLAWHRMHAGNLQGATAVLEDWFGGSHPDFEARGGRRRWVPARYLLGLLYMRQGHHNLASSQFTRVRASRGALASEAAWLEALSDHRRGRHAVAARECGTYREQWPEGSHAADCQLLMGDAYTAAGYYQPAHDAYQAFIDLDPDGPDVEIAKLGQALALTNRSKKQAVLALQTMALDYSYPTTHNIAMAALEELAQTGQDTALPDDSPSKMRSAFSALRAREYGKARALWAELSASEEPRTQSWVAKHRETFGWRTRNYAALVALFTERYEANPSADNCWMAHRAAARGGLWQQAAEWGERGLEHHGGHWRWKRARDDVALARMLAGDNARAMELWDGLARKGGAAGRQARWYGAFCAWRASELDEAAKRMEQVRAQDRAHATRALYYLARIAQLRGEDDQATELYAEVLEEDPLGWYGLLATRRLQPADSQAERWLARTGGWPYATPAADTVLAPMPVAPPPRAVQPPVHGTLEPPPTRALDWSSLAWGAPSSHESGPLPAQPTQESPERDGITRDAPGEVPPFTVFEGPHYDAAHARRAFSRFAEAQQGLWPELLDAYAAAEVGAYDLAGELVAKVHHEVEQGQRGRGPRASQVRGIQKRLSEWRELFLFTRAWHLISRFSMGLDKHADDDEQRLIALGMAYPAAFPGHVWGAGREHDIDPLLVLAVMRQESQYKSWALSNAGAVGLMQVLPVTGALVARDIGRVRYSPRELLEPSSNIDFGAWYLRSLLTRFNGCSPMAVAAYNAGPQAVSSWYAAQDDDIPVDDFVEMIPIDETRTYVRRVLGFYSLYAQVHGPPGARVALAMIPAGDEPAVIDY